ncbi:protein FAM209-like [Apodemus sylvaticus]|uniref:protein FAM209-like n=1 Tax=Apodemus sylvaticus TaxID=10129 RepID=UPI00224473A3|nr:protein FAM209-like [Apodemus sylvaticus]
MRTLTWLLVLPLCVSCACAFMFSSLREKTKENPGKVPCGGHFRIRQNLPENAQGWLGNKWLWLFIVIMTYVILKFRGDGEKNKEQNPPGLRGCQFRSPPKKAQTISPSKDFTFNTLTQLEMELVKFVSKVRNLKVSMATSSNARLQIPDLPMDPYNNVTIYEIWGEEESE